MNNSPWVLAFFCQKTKGFFKCKKPNYLENVLVFWLKLRTGWHIVDGVWISTFYVLQNQCTLWKFRNSLYSKPVLIIFQFDCLWALLLQLLWHLILAILAKARALKKLPILSITFLHVTHPSPFVLRPQIVRRVWERCAITFLSHQTCDPPGDGKILWIYFEERIRDISEDCNIISFENL